jgi:hypothetical protein
MQKHCFRVDEALGVDATGWPALAIRALDDGWPKYERRLHWPPVIRRIGSIVGLQSIRQRVQNGQFVRRLAQDLPSCATWTFLVLFLVFMYTIGDHAYHTGSDHPSHHAFHLTLHLFVPAACGLQNTGDFRCSIQWALPGTGNMSRNARHPQSARLTHQ